MGQRMHCLPSDRKSKGENNDNTYKGMTYSQLIDNPHDNPKVKTRKTGNLERWKNPTDCAETIRSFKEHSHGLELGEKIP